MKYFLQKVSFVIVLAFFLFVVAYHKQKVSEIISAVEEHARIVAASIWDLNYQGSEEYLLAVAMLYDYQTVMIKDTAGIIHIKFHHPSINSFEKALIRLKLIPQVRFSKDIVYNEEILGKVEVLWLDKSIFMYTYGFVIGLLLLTVAYLYERVLRAKNTLEKKVALRTSELNERSRALQESERRFRTLVDHATDAIFVTDVEGHLIDTNGKALETLGYSRKEILKLAMADIDTGYADNNYWQNVGKLGLLRQTLFESLLVKKDGSKFPVELNIGSIEIEGKPAIIGIARDISKRKQEENQRLHLEAQLGQAQKLEAIGTLAGGIAHDFNNILAPIYGYTELAMLKLSTGGEIKNHLHEIFKAAHRAKELVQQILTFSRQEVQQQAPIEVHIVVKEALKLLRASIPATIEINQNIDEHCGAVMANPTQIHQILMNLCTNAYHSMREKGGMLAVSLRPITIEAGNMVNAIDLQPGNYLRLEVSDTGYGMDIKTKARIFEPYFTTKTKDEGTGLGLSIAHGIVKSHGGRISVYSEPGQGSTFHVYWPTLETFGTKSIAESAEPLPLGNERVILIDDEEATLKVEAVILENLGYSVLSFADPLEALQCIKKNPDLFDLVITDMTMPRMTGVDVFQSIMTMRIDLPVILCSGFSEIINESKAREMGIKALVMKPIIISEFSKLLRSVLDSVETS